MSESETGRLQSGASRGGLEVRAMNVRERDLRGGDETLRMIARMPAPEGLEERVKAGLHLAEARGRVLSWPMARRGDRVWAGNPWIRSGWVRGAAAAAIALVVAGGGWGIYTRVEPAQSARNVALPQAQPSGAFSEAGAMRRPQTLTGPMVAEPELKGPAAVKPTDQKAGQKAVRSQVSHRGGRDLGHAAPLAPTAAAK